MVYNLAIKEYGAASTIGTRLSLRYQMNASLQSVFSLLNVNHPQIGKSKEPLPQVISGGYCFHLQSRYMANFRSFTI